MWDTGRGQLIVQAVIDRRRGPGLKGDALGAEPAPDVLDELGLLLDSAPGMVRRVEVRGVEFDPVAEEVGPDLVTIARSTEALIQHGGPRYG